MVVEVLVERAAQRHVEDLHATADREQRMVPFDAPPGQRKVEGVAAGGRRVGSRVGRGAVVRRAHVGTADDHNAVDAIEQRVDRIGF